jgi:hypothetical protein
MEHLLGSKRDRTFFGIGANSRKLKQDFAGQVNLGRYMDSLEILGKNCAKLREMIEQSEGEALIRPELQRIIREVRDESAEALILLDRFQKYGV